MSMGIFDIKSSINPIIKGNILVKNFNLSNYSSGEVYSLFVIMRDVTGGNVVVEENDLS